MEEAAECFRRAGSFLNLGLLLLEGEDFAGAVEPLRTATLLQPSLAAGYLALAECLLGMGQVRPYSARALRGMGLAAERMGKTEEAQLYREKSLEAADQGLELQPLILETPLG